MNRMVRMTCLLAVAVYASASAANIDWSAVDRLLAMRNITPATVPSEEFARQRSQFAHGNSGLPIVGDPDHVARELIALRHGDSDDRPSFTSFASTLSQLQSPSP